MQEVTEREAAEGLAGRAMTEFGGLLQPFMDRQMPDCLRQGAPPPESWTGSAESWAELAGQARDAFRLKPYLEAALAIGERGYRPEELISGRLTPGSTLNVVTGRVRRPLASTLSIALEQQAREALDELHRRHLKLDEPVLQRALELAAVGAWQSQSSTVEGAVKAAEAAVRAYDREREQARAEADARPWLVCHLPFRGPGGRQFAVGRTRVDPALVEELKVWAAKVESNARGKTLASIGYPTWPVFSVEAN